MFRQVGRVALTLGLVRLGELGFEGTRVKANNSRYATRTAATLEEKLAELDRQVEQMLSEAEATDAQESRLFGPDESVTKLPLELAELKRRQEQVRQALERAQAADAARRSKGVNPEKNPSQVPTTDPDSRVMSNKEGGYAPNYTPTATTDGHRGYIVDADVIAEVNEGAVAAAAMDRIEEGFGEKPQKLLTDAGNNSGLIQQQMEQRGIELYTPAESSQPAVDNPARRDDPTQAVPQSKWPQLPLNPQGRLDKSCFVYDATEDQYYCPLGHAMPLAKTTPDHRGGERITLRVYRCAACVGCPLAGVCLSERSQRGRTITRDPYEAVRERTAARMACESARRVYDERPRIAETTFGLLKRVMGLRQFLLRGLEKVRTEWLWVCTAFNLAKLARELGRLRARFAELLPDADEQAAVIPQN